MKSANVFRVLAFGDIIGDPGRRALNNVLKKLRDKYFADMVIVNGENSAHGFGITQSITEELLNSGVDAVTSGNHVWQKKEVFNFLDEYEALLRPINYPDGTPGHGSVILEKNGVKCGVINAMGRIYMDPLECPFTTVRTEAEKMERQGVKIILVDFHAEATSEKQILARFLDGKVSAVWGTHTHVLTADERILPQGTAYISDIGMCGCIESIIGMKIEESYRRVVQLLPVRFSPADEGTMEVNGVVIDLERDTGKALMINRIREVAGEYHSKKN